MFCSHEVRSLQSTNLNLNLKASHHQFRPQNSWDKPPPQSHHPIIHLHHSHPTLLPATTPINTFTLHLLHSLINGLKRSHLAAGRGSAPPFRAMEKRPKSSDEVWANKRLTGRSFAFQLAFKKTNTSLKTCLICLFLITRLFFCKF